MDVMTGNEQAMLQALVCLWDGNVDGAVEALEPPVRARIGERAFAEEREMRKPDDARGLVHRDLISDLRVAADRERRAREGDQPLPEFKQSGKS